MENIGRYHVSASGTYLKAHPSHRSSWILRCSKLRRGLNIYGVCPVGMIWFHLFFPSLHHPLAFSTAAFDANISRIMSTHLKIKRFLDFAHQPSNSSGKLHWNGHVVSRASTYVLYILDLMHMSEQPRFISTARRRLRINRAWTGKKKQNAPNGVHECLLQQNVYMGIQLKPLKHPSWQTGLW